MEDTKLPDYLTTEDFYKQFRYKKRDIEGNKVYPPYIKLKDCSDHKYSLTYRQWMIILNTFFEVLVEKMIQGFKFEMPARLGHLQILRDKGKKIFKGRMYRNTHTQGYYPLVAWFRHKEADFRRKRWYKFNFSRAIVWKRISNILFEDPSIIYNFDLNRNKKDR